MQTTASRVEEVELVLRAAGQAAPRLRDLVTGVAISGAVPFGILEAGGHRIVRQSPDEKGVYRLPVRARDVVALVVGVPGYALESVRGPFPAEPPPVEVGLLPRYRSFTLEVRPEAPAPCSVTLLDESGRPVSLSVAYPPGPAPLATRSALFNFLPARDYTLVVTPCQGSPVTRPLSLTGPSIPHLVVP